MRRRAYTILEVLVVLALAVLVTGMALACWSTLHRGQAGNERRRSLQREVRQALAVLYQDFSSASYVYYGYNGSAGGRKYTVAAPGVAGGEILFAIPENGLKGSQTFTLEGGYSQPLTPSDPNNPAAQQLVIWRKTGQKPTVADSPASFNLAALSGGSTKIYRTCHLLKDLSFTSIGSSTLVVDLDFTCKLSGGRWLHDEQSLEVSARNL